MSDPINPEYYHGTKVDEFIEEFELGFRPGTAVKYIARHQDKGNPVQDLKKAIWYLQREVSRLQERSQSSSRICPVTNERCTCPCTGSECLRRDPDFQGKK